MRKRISDGMRLIRRKEIFHWRVVANPAEVSFSSWEIAPKVELRETGTPFGNKPRVIVATHDGERTIRFNSYSEQRGTTGAIAPFRDKFVSPVTDH